MSGCVGEDRWKRFGCAVFEKVDVVTFALRILMRIVGGCQDCCSRDLAAHHQGSVLGLASGCVLGDDAPDV